MLVLGNEVVAKAWGLTMSIDRDTMRTVFE